jgi:hypothetical protein
MLPITPFLWNLLLAHYNRPVQSHLPIEEYPKAWAEYQRRWLLSWVPSLIVFLFCAASATTGIGRPTPLLLLAFAFYLVGYLRFISWHCPRCDKRFTFPDAHRIERSDSCLFCGLKRGARTTGTREDLLKQHGRPIPEHSNSSTSAMMKRFFHVAVGMVMALLGLFHRTVQGHPVPLWRTAFIVLCGLGLFYIGAMYYFPRNARKRDELNRLLDDAEAEMNQAESKIGSQR